MEKTIFVGHAGKTRLSLPERGCAGIGTFLAQLPPAPPAAAAQVQRSERAQLHQKRKKNPQTFLMLMKRFKVLVKCSKSVWVCVRVLRRHNGERTASVATSLR